jgi:hypothetical protein
MPAGILAYPRYDEWRRTYIVSIQRDTTKLNRKLSLEDVKKLKAKD